VRIIVRYYISELLSNTLTVMEYSILGLGYIFEYSYSKVWSTRVL